MTEPAPRYPDSGCLTGGGAGGDEAASQELVVGTLLEAQGAVLSLAGELDMATAPALRRALDDLGAPGATIVVDLAGLEFIDSSGLNELVLALRRQRDDGGDVVLRSPRPHTRKVLEIAGLTQLFTVT